MVRVGIIGRGWGEKSQMPNFRDAGLDVVVITGRDGWQPVVERRDIDLISVPGDHVTAVLPAIAGAAQWLATQRKA